MMSARVRKLLGPSILRRVMRSYGLLILIALFFLVLAMFVREKPKIVPAESAGLRQEVQLWH